MIGDSGTDVRTARAAQVPVIAVDFGYSEVPIATLQPDRIISAYGELPVAIAGVVAERPQRAEPALINLNEFSCGRRPRHCVAGVASYA